MGKGVLNSGTQYMPKTTSSNRCSVVRRSKRRYKLVSFWEAEGETCCFFEVSFEQ